MPRIATRKRPLKVELRHRINAGRVAVLSQLALFERLFGNVSADWKEDDTRVTFADFAISEKILSSLGQQFPNDDLLSEEGAGEGVLLKGDFAWLLDPIDGTNNFYFGIPICGISLALLHNGQPIFGFIYDFSRRKLMEGGPSGKTSDGSSPARVCETPFSEKSLCGLHFPLSEAELESCRPLLTRCRIRSLGSTALNLAWTASGKLDGTLDFGTRVWDVAAGFALIGGAGGHWHILGNSPFPLLRFDPSSPEKVAFYAGSNMFCEAMEQLLTLRLLPK